MSDLRVLAFDPSMNQMGVVVMDIQLFPFHVTEVHRETTNGGKLYRSRKHMHDRFSEQYCKVDAVTEKVDQLFEIFKPDEACCEGAFAGKNPAAIVSLTLCIGILRRATHQHLDKDIHMIAPTQTKKAVTQCSQADKDAMRRWYDLCTYITKLPGVATEHEIDAEAHGITGVLRDITKTYIPELTPREKKRLRRELEKKNK